MRVAPAVGEGAVFHGEQGGEGEGSGCDQDEGGEEAHASIMQQDVRRLKPRSSPPGRLAQAADADGAPEEPGAHDDPDAEQDRRQEQHRHGGADGDDRQQQRGDTHAVPDLESAQGLVPLSQAAAIVRPFTAKKM